jgi:hypothetical protein
MEALEWMPDKRKQVYNGYRRRSKAANQAEADDEDEKGRTLMPAGANVNPLEEALGRASGDGSVERRGGEEDYEGFWRGHKGEAWTDERGSTVPSLVRAERQRRPG